MTRRERLRFAEATRRVATLQLERQGITPARGVPASLSDGIHAAGWTVAEIHAACRIYEETGSDWINPAEFTTPDRVELFKTAQRLLYLHANDVTVPNGYVPADFFVRPNFADLVFVLAGMAVGYLAVNDSRLTPGDAVTPDYVPRYDTLTNVWVAHEHRREGVAARLLIEARGRYPVSRLQRPFTPAGRMWITTLAPDLVGVGRNQPCPCGSGRKHKRCCLAVEAA